jgi:hypothetical protein
MNPFGFTPHQARVAMLVMFATLAACAMQLAASGATAAFQGAH